MIYTPNLIPLMTSETTPSGVASSSIPYAEPYNPWWPFSGMQTRYLITRWMVDPAWVQYQFAVPPIPICRYTLSDGGEAGQQARNPGYLCLSASNDGVDWVDLANHQTFGLSLNEKRTFDFYNSTVYSHYRLTFTSSVDSDCYSIGPIELMGLLSESPHTHSISALIVREPLAPTTLSIGLTTGGDVPWIASTESVEGTAYVSGDIGDNESTWLQYDFVGPKASLFWWKVSSEDRYDFLTLYVDGVEAASLDGVVGWTEFPVDVVGAGPHSLRWVYAKDSSASEGSDSAWVDVSALAPASVFVQATATLDCIVKELPLPPYGLRFYTVEARDAEGNWSIVSESVSNEVAVPAPTGVWTTTALPFYKVSPTSLSFTCHTPQTTKEDYPTPILSSMVYKDDGGSWLQSGPQTSAVDYTDFVEGQGWVDGLPLHPNIARHKVLNDTQTLPKTWSQGAHNITLRATLVRPDETTFYGDEFSFDFHIDNVAPVTTSNAGNGYSGPATITLAASDNVGGSGLAHTYHSLDGGVQNEGLVVIVPETYPQGQGEVHTLTFWSVDNAGNVEATKSATFKVWTM